MGYLEDQVEKLEKRIQKIKANPDPKKPVANLLLYEAELDQRKSQIAAQQEGRPFAISPSSLYALIKALGFEVFNMIQSADRVTPEDVPHYIEQVTQLGYPDYFCDRTLVCLPPMLIERGLPRPKLSVGVHVCELESLDFSTIGHGLNIPFFHIDIPFYDDYKPHLGYVVRQLEELITFAEEKVPGIKYNEDSLRGWLEVESEWYALNRQIYELRKRVPCPEHPQDVFRSPPSPLAFPRPEKIVEYVRAVRDELSARVERGYSPVKEERLRLLWTTTGPFGSKIWDLLLERGVTVPYVHFGANPRRYGVGGLPGIGDTTEFGRKLSPIEEVVRMQLGNSFGCTAKLWIDQVLTACRECQIDAIVNFDQDGCIPTFGYSRLLKEATERELGIPSLNIVGRELVRTKQDEERFLDQVDNFITGCLKRKGF